MQNTLTVQEARDALLDSILDPRRSTVQVKGRFVSTMTATELNSVLAGLRSGDIKWSDIQVAQYPSLWPAPIPIVEKHPEGDCLAFGVLGDDPNAHWYTTYCDGTFVETGEPSFLDIEGQELHGVTHWLPMPPSPSPADTPQ